MVCTFITFSLISRIRLVFFFLYGAVGGGWRTIKEKAAKIYSTS